MSGPTYNEQLRDVVEVYRTSDMPWPASTKQLAAWAIDAGLWKPHPRSVIGQCAEYLARAMRVDTFVDPQGRTVRAKHAARVWKNGEQLVLWEDIRTAPREHMEISLQQRRLQVIGDCRQLKNDVDSFNENTNSGSPTQMVFDFTQDLAEREALDAMKAVLV